MDTPRSSFLRLRLSTLLLMMFSFALGLAVRNIADGLHPFTMSLSLPKSTTPLRPGDELRIEFPRLESLSREVVVLADWKISLPQIGDMSVKGHTVKSLEQELRKKYAPLYTKGPSIASTLEVYRGNASAPIR